MGTFLYPLSLLFVVILHITKSKDKLRSKSLVLKISRYNLSLLFLIYSYNQDIEGSSSSQIILQQSVVFHLLLNFFMHRALNPSSKSFQRVSLIIFLGFWCYMPNGSLLLDPQFQYLIIVEFSRIYFNQQIWSFYQGFELSPGFDSHQRHWFLGTSLTSFSQQLSFICLLMSVVLVGFFASYYILACRLRFIFLSGPFSYYILIFLDVHLSFFLIYLVYMSEC